MKRFLLFFAAAVLLAACDNKFEDEGNTIQRVSNLPTLTAEFADEDTRTYVEDNFYLRWHEGDLISAFVGNTRNSKYIFDGKTGDNSGTFGSSESSLGSSDKLDRNYALYPYDKSVNISVNGVISCSLPAVQEYAEESFGKGANTMVAVTKSTDDTFLAFKNACGYLKVKLYGKATVKSIELKGNNGEKIAGEASITATYGGVPTVAMAEDATESISLDCGEGVKLSTDAEKPTEFWFVVPPTEFSDGLTIVATDIYGTTFEKSTSNAVTITRNQIQPMAAVEVESEEVAKPANNEIWYTAKEKVVPNYDAEFGATLLSNTYNSTTKEGLLTFDSDVTKIGDKAFYECYSLTSVTIPDSVTTIGVKAFWDCSRLTSVTIPDSVTTIGERAFYQCASLTSVTIPDSVTTIGDYAFYSCDSLTSVTIPDSVITIGGGTFWCCDSLTSVTIPDSVTTIGKGAFAYCESFTEFKGKFASDGGRCLIIDGVLNSFAPAGLTEYIIPDSVTTIGDYAFADCHSLTSVTIPDSVITIGDYAFEYCTSLTSVTIPDSVTTIGDYVFSSCESLTGVTIPDSVTTIGDCAFRYCTSLTSVTIGDSVRKIGYWAFFNCTSLTSVYSKPTTPPSMEDDVFLYTNNIQAIYVPTDSVEAYKAASYWKNYADKIEGYDF